eukprot:scaffold56645_cov35-Tisochrysis_lutea.AAC.1
MALSAALLLLALERRWRRRRKHPSYSFKLQDVTLWRSHLAEEGFVVLRGVLSPQECEKAVSLIWDWLEGLGSGLKRADLASWTKDAWPGHQRFGFFTTHGGGQSEGAWYVRSRPAVVRAFAGVWGTNALITSLDVPIAWRPWWLDSSWTPTVERLHVDQNPFFKPGFHCVQGMVPLLGQDAHTGGLQVVPRTHTDAVQEYLRDKYPDLANDSDDWCELQLGDHYLRKGVLLNAERGDLILWDSRLIHGGLVGQGPPVIMRYLQRLLHLCGASVASYSSGGGGLARLSCTVCMTERARASADVVRQRHEATMHGSALTHWPHQSTPHTLGDTGGARIGTKFTPPPLTPEQLALIG